MDYNDITNFSPKFCPDKEQLFGKFSKMMTQ
jgi:hypothetical protein